MAGLSHFCGFDNSSHFVVWDDKTKHFGSCFQWLCLTSSSHFVFAIICAYLLGKSRRKASRFYPTLKLRILSLALCYLNATSAIVAAVLAYVYKKPEPPPAFVLSKTVTFSSWLVCIILQHKIMKERTKIKFYLKPLCFAGVLILTSSSIQLYDHVERSGKMFPHSIEDWYALVYCSLNALFLAVTFIGLCKRGKQITFGRMLPSLLSIQQPRSEKDDFVEDALLGTKVESYDSCTVRSSSSVQDTVLGWAEEEANFLSKIFFWWVNPLMRKGSKFNLQKAEDLFLLPLTLDTKMIKEIFQSILRLQKLNSYSSFKQKKQQRNTKRSPTLEGGEEAARKPLLVSLVKALNRGFGIFYYSIGILKFLADCLAFAGPVLLNLLVSFMENKKVGMLSQRCTNLAGTF